MSPSDDILIIYGSQTGQAESIAQQICDRINVELNINPSPNIYSMDQIEKQASLVEYQYNLQYPNKVVVLDRK